MATVLYGISKQPSEKFYIAGEFRKNMETDETLVLVSSSVSAVDKDDSDVSATILDQSTLAVDGTQLQIRLQAGAEDKSPYQVTFLATTSIGNVWEVDLKVEITEI